MEKLGGGDMRKSLNILQSAALASDTITEDSVYLCTGACNLRSSNRTSCVVVADAVVVVVVVVRVRVGITVVVAVVVDAGS